MGVESIEIHFTKKKRKRERERERNRVRKRRQVAFIVPLVGSDVTFSPLSMIGSCEFVKQRSPGNASHRHYLRHYYLENSPGTRHSSKGHRCTTACGIVSANFLVFRKERSFHYNTKSTIESTATVMKKNPFREFLLVHKKTPENIGSVEIFLDLCSRLRKKK